MITSSQEQLPLTPTLDTSQMQLAAREACALLRAVANEHRLIILCSISQGERTVGELQQLLPLSQSALSQHLARLRRDGLVSRRRSGQHIYYSLPPGPVERILETLYELFCKDPA